MAQLDGAFDATFSAPKSNYGVIPIHARLDYVLLA